MISEGGERERRERRKKKEKSEQRAWKGRGERKKKDEKVKRKEKEREKEERVQVLLRAHNGNVDKGFPTPCRRHGKSFKFSTALFWEAEEGEGVRRLGRAEERQ